MKKLFGLLFFVCCCLLVCTSLRRRRTKHRDFKRRIKRSVSKDILLSVKKCWPKVQWEEKQSAEISRTCLPNVRQLRETPRNRSCPHLFAPVRQLRETPRNHFDIADNWRTLGAHFWTSMEILVRGQKFIGRPFLPIRYLCRV